MQKSRRIPAYVHHKPTGQARVRIAGRDHYLGVYGTAASHDRYDELIASFLESGQPQQPAKSLTAVLAAWWVECKKRYSKGKGPYGGAGNWRPLIRLLRENCGSEPADQLSPKRLRTLLEREAEARGWSQTYVRDQLARVRTIFKWAAAEELIGIDAYQRLTVVEIRTGKRTKPLPPVSDELVEKTMPLLRPRIAAMVRLQRLTGMRPGELVAMRKDEVDRSGDVWVYVPRSHKTEHHGKSRSVYVGPQAQRVLGPLLLKAVDFVFPAAGQSGRPYSTDSYRRAIQRVCEKHGLPIWSPNQLRKACATEVRRQLDVEAAASLLGHSSSQVTANHYAGLDQRRAIDAARLLG